MGGKYKSTDKKKKKRKKSHKMWLMGNLSLPCSILPITFLSVGTWIYISIIFVYKMIL